MTRTKIMNTTGPNKKTDQTGDLFLESPGNFSDPESCFVFAGFAFKIKFY